MGRRGNWWGRRHQGRGGWGSGWGGWCSPEFQQQMFNHFAGYQQQQQQTGCPKKDNGNGSKDESKTSEGSSNTEQQQAFPSGEEYLKNVGSAVSDFLKPFGIDVDVSVDHNGIRTSVNTRKPEETTGNKEEQATCSKNMDGQNKSGNEKAAPSSGDQGEQTPPHPSPFTVPVKVTHESKIRKDDVLKKVSSQSSNEGEWTMVKEDEDTTESKPSSSGQEGATEKQKPSEEKQPANPDRKRQPGPLDLLLAMGFKDENGSLERLLNACQNDIGKVLENMEKMNFKM